MSDDRPFQSAPRPLIDPTLVASLPGLVRVASSGLWRLAQWAVTTPVNTAARVVGSLLAGEPPAHVVAAATDDVRNAARQFLGIADVSTNGARAASPRPATASSRPKAGVTAEELRARGARLLQDSADVWFSDDTHPAYARILEDLSPDEARILRFLAVEGPQPSVDVRTHRPLGVGSELVAGGLSMIGLQAGVRRLDRAHAALNNLERLGLVWFSREQVSDPTRYQVVEVQPDVLEAMKRAGRSPRTVHRSIHLTPFGEDFCAVCLPLSSPNGKEPPAPV